MQYFPKIEKQIPMNNVLVILGLFSFLSLFPRFSIAQNTTCQTALIVQPDTFTTPALTGNGAIFQGATAAAWYRYTPAEAGIFTVSSCNGGADTRLVIMLLEDCENQSDLQIINSITDNCADGNGGNTASTVAVLAQPGFSYVIYWDDAQSAAGFSWILDFESANEGRPGETCATAQSIEAGIHQVDSLTGTGTAFLDAVSARWYAFTPERDGALFISSCESAVDTRLFVWEGNCGNRTILAQDDNGCGASGASDLNNAPVTQGETYYIYWDDHATKAGFSFEIKVEGSSVGTSEPEWAKDIHIFPNPANQQFFIAYNFSKTPDLTFSISNHIGQIIKTQPWHSFNRGKIGIFTNNMPNGIYFIKIADSQAQVVRRILINHVP